MTPLVTAVASSSSPQNTSLPTTSITSLGNTSHLVNPNRGPPQNRHQAAVSQGARGKPNRTVTSQVVVQLLDMLDEVKEEL